MNTLVLMIVVGSIASIVILGLHLHATEKPDGPVRRPAPAEPDATTAPGDPRPLTRRRNPRPDRAAPPDGPSAPPRPRGGRASRDDGAARRPSTP
jgi:hypothetical protein